MHNHSTAKINALLSLLRQDKDSVFAEHVIEKHGGEFEINNKKNGNNCTTIQQLHCDTQNCMKRLCHSRSGGQLKAHHPDKRL